MNILFSVPRIHTNYTGMIEGLINDGHKVSFVTMNGDEIYVPFDFDVGVHHFRPRGRFFIPSNHTKLLHFESFSSLNSVLNKVAPNLIISRDLKILNIQISLLAKIKRIPVLYYDQTLPSKKNSLKGSLWEHASRLLISKYRMTTVNENQNFDPVPDNVFFIPFAVPVTRVKNSYKTVVDEKHPLRLMVVSKLGERRKNLIFLLQSLLPIFKEKKIHLSIYGMLKNIERSQQNFKQLNDFIHAHRLTEQIDIYPNEVYENVLNVYSEHDLFILPSLNEPAAISPFEAMSSGLPVIVTSQNGTNYVINEGVNGFVFNPEDKTELKHFVEHFIDNPDKLEQFGRQALKSVHQNYRPNNFSANITSIAKQIAE